MIRPTDDEHQLATISSRPAGVIYQPPIPTVVDTSCLQLVPTVSSSPVIGVKK
jgi:hypothetical protein